MKTIEIKEKLHHYIETAKDKKLKAIYMMVEDDIAAKHDYWNDESFIKDLNEREENYLNNTSKKYSIEQSVANAKKNLKK